MMKEIGQRLKELREERGKTQEDVRYYLRRRGIETSKQTISAFERGIQYPNLKTLVELANFYDVSTDFILCRIDYSTDRDRQFEQLLIEYRKDIENKPLLIKENSNSILCESYRIIATIIDNNSEFALDSLVNILVNLRMVLIEATLNRKNILSQNTKYDVKQILTGIKNIYGNTEELKKNISSLIANIAIPYNNLPKLEEFEDMSNKLNLLILSREEE